MKTFSHLKVLSLGLMSVLMLGACAETVTSKNPIVDPSAGGTADTTTTTKRTCTDEMDSTVTAARLAGFFGKVVRNIEGPVTFCITLGGSGKNLTGTLRIEYEDDFGIRTYESADSNRYYGEIKQDDVTSTTTMDLILVDKKGFVEIKGTSVGTENMNATVKYYNFPTFEEGITQAAQDAQQKCKDGTWTYAQCMGYNFPQTFWWNETYFASPQAYVLSLAQAVLADTTKTKTLGGMSFDLAKVLSQ